MARVPADAFALVEQGSSLVRVHSLGREVDDDSFRRHEVPPGAVISADSTITQFAVETDEKAQHTHVVTLEKSAWQRLF